MGYQRRKIGIDIWMSTTAINTGLKIVPAQLGTKVQRERSCRTLRAYVQAGSQHVNVPYGKIRTKVEERKRKCSG